jgi:hypothetical protein
MYPGITKIYYRKTVGHVFTKPVQTGGGTNFFLFFYFLLFGFLVINVCNHEEHYETPCIWKHPPRHFFCANQPIRYDNEVLTVNTGLLETATRTTAKYDRSSAVLLVFL